MNCPESPYPSKQTRQTSTVAAAVLLATVTLQVSIAAQEISGSPQTPGSLSAVTSSAVAPVANLTVAAVTPEEAAASAIHNYVQRDEPEFAWKIARTHQKNGATITELRVTSQRWQDILWEHAVEVYQPAKLEYPEHVLLFVTGGSQPPKDLSEKDAEMGLQMAAVSGMRVAVLHQVPNQPLLGNRVEDDLITETWLRYLKTGDESWPLLFAMVKSAVKTMDAVQEFTAQDGKKPVSSFIITGASKRGWTSWLTPVADKRVVATAPIVIDVLNFRAQMKHQIDTWGKYSEQIIDYTSKGLIVEGEENDRERQLRLMMDPYSYRETLTLPKLLVNGTNDPYWVVDAMKLYWDDLKGPRYALFLPNDGHGLENGRRKALTTISIYARMNAAKMTLPELDWEFGRDGETRSVRVHSSQPPTSAHLWSAQSADLDFRDEKWSEVKMSESDGAIVGSVIGKEGKHVAMYAELIFEVAGVPYSLCTLVERN
ncbi:MAG: PhoPQ-activated protein PqaA family protein [Planctomycetaceae bacterium]